MSKLSLVQHNFHPDYRPDIDGLRALAILVVVLFHAFPKTLRGGFVGVDVFFVISGFLISTIILRSLKQEMFSFPAFYANRVRRIFPALILVLVSSVLLGWFALLPDELAQLGKHMAGGAGFVQNFLLWSEAGYFDTHSELKPLMHLWSLAIEEQFYLIYPFGMWLAWRLRLSLTRVMLVLCLVSFSLNVWNVTREPLGTFFLPHTRFWELLIGGLLACLPLQTDQTPSRSSNLFAVNEQIVKNVAAILGVLLILLASFVLNKGRQFPGWWALLPVVGSSLLILSGQKAWVNRVILSSSPMIWIGLISYPLYLWHWPILSFARIVESDEPSAWGRVMLISLSFVLAWLTSRLVEGPIRFGVKSVGRITILCGLISSLGIFGYWLYVHQGVSGRFANDGYTAFSWAKGVSNRAFCQAVFDGPGYPESCLLAEGRVPEIALLGDSHSGHLYPGLASQGLAVANLGRGACLPLYNVGFGKDGSECKFGYMNRVLDFAIADERVRLIALAGRYAAAVEGGEYDVRHPDRPGGMELFSQDVSGNAKVFEKSLRQTLGKLVASGKKVVVILDVPELGFNPKSCVRPMTLTTLRQVPCAVSADAFDKRSRQYRDIVRSVARDYPSVNVFDMPSLFCDQSYCWGQKNGKMLYRDDDHLSLEGSDFVARHLGPYLKSMLD
jgi:peptidoglycan/LPS O-acetylase OafA/YrhL